MSLLGLRHLALWIDDAVFAATVEFYRSALDMHVQWQPDDDNVYLSSGGDNLALHRAKPPRVVAQQHSPLDHLGFCVEQAEEVAARRDQVERCGGTIEQEPRTHRDGATSFYARDPAGNLLQVLHIPGLTR
ncbi:MAG: VOC family protein [Deltaproteobacteria bacterium]|nr:VOC family protein [Nannocystaceae bacterium]